MALSNWDTLAIRSDGDIYGVLTTPAGVEVEIYKNWLYVRDPDAWREGRFTAPTIMEVTSGEITYRDLTVNAWRGPQNGVFVVAIAGWRENPTAVMVGCGVYGFDEQDPDDEADPKWIGVHRDSVDFLRARVVEDLGEDHPFVNAVQWDALGRFNQGDARLARQVDVADPTTPPGESDAPFLIAALDLSAEPSAD